MHVWLISNNAYILSARGKSPRVRLRDVKVHNQYCSGQHYLSETSDRIDFRSSSPVISGVLELASAGRSRKVGEKNKSKWLNLGDIRRKGRNLFGKLREKPQ